MNATTLPNDDSITEADEPPPKTATTTLDLALLRAIRCLNTKSTILLLQKGANANAKFPEQIARTNGRTPLLAACSSSRIKLVGENRREEWQRERNLRQIVAALLQAGADPNTRTQSNNSFASPLEYACRKGRLETVELLLEYGAKPMKSNIPNNADDDDDDDDDASLYRHSPAIAQIFLDACSKGHLRLVQLLLDASNDTLLTIRDEGRRFSTYGTGLHSALFDIRDGDEGLDMVRELIRRGADLCSRDHTYSIRTPLDCWWYRNSGNHRLANELILETYAERIWRQHGDQSLHFCLRKMGTLVAGRVRFPVGNLDQDQLLRLFRFLIQRDVNSLRAPSTDKRKELPIHVAIRRVAPIFVIGFLAEQDPASLRVADGATGSLPIHAACGGRGTTRKEMQLLIEMGGVETLATRDRAGAMPLHRMVDGIQSKVAPFSALSNIKYVLKMYPAAVSAKTRQGILPFMLAAFDGESTASDTCARSSSDTLSVVYELVRAEPQEVVVAAASKGQTKKNPSTPNTDPATLNTPIPSCKLRSSRLDPS